MSERNPPTVGFVSLGCPKNLVDSERILTQLRAEGYALSDSYDGADLVVVNTCGFIDAAVEESLETIGEALSDNGRVIVTGCLGARDDEVRAAHPGVLGITGPHAYEAVMGLVHQALPPPAAPFSGLMPAAGVKLTPRHYAYLKIAEGCDQKCSFCIIPALRGPQRSRPLDAILGEAESLVQGGVRELLVVAQDTADYGRDLRHRPAFWKGRPLRSRIQDLAAALGELGIWVRLHYIYPHRSVDELLPLMADGKLLPYLDLPLQHADRTILRAMRRPAAAERMLERIQAWRTQCPDLTLRSTFIVGFPGEGEAEFETLLGFLREARLDRVGAFAYSPVRGAAANALPGAVPEALKQERLERFMEVQSEISARKLGDKIGRREIVLVDEVHEEHWIGRTAGDAPEIDGVVVVDGAWELDPGDFVEVEITGSDEHDLFARVPEEAEA